MLEESSAKVLTDLLSELVCEVELPSEWQATFFSATGPTQTSFDERRQFVRHHFRSKAVLELQSSLPRLSRDKEKHIVLTCDVARNGFGFLHAQQLYPGELAKLWLPSKKVTVKIARCKKHNDKCYLIGAMPSS